VRLVSITDPKGSYASKKGEKFDAGESGSPTPGLTRPPIHRNYSSLRLFGADAGGPKQFRGRPVAFPARRRRRPRRIAHEKVYTCLSGELT
jgi:hypothetical protein